MSDRPARIGFKVWAGGTVYYLTKVRLVPHETRMIDLRKLRDAQRPDFKGNRIPAGATDGSVLWIRLDNVPVMGRLAVIGRHGGVASNYDCCYCGCPASYESLSMSPVPPSCMTVNSSAQCDLSAGYFDCNGGGWTYNDVTSSATWTSTNTGVATVTAGLVKTVADGSTTITGAFTDATYPQAPEFCTPKFKQIVTQAAMTVNQLSGFAISVTSTPVTGETNSVVSGQSADVQVTAQNDLQLTDVCYVGTATLSSTDPFATLGSYNYTIADAGVHTFSVTLKTVAGTSATRDLTVKDSTTGVSATQNIDVWFETTMDEEVWHNCNVTTCPDSGAYACKTACDTNGLPKNSQFVAITQKLCNVGVRVRTMSGSVASTTAQDCGPLAGGGCGNPYWNTGTVPAKGGCLSDALMGALGIAHTCSTGEATVFWRFQ